MAESLHTDTAAIAQPALSSSVASCVHIDSTRTIAIPPAVRRQITSLPALSPNDEILAPFFRLTMCWFFDAAAAAAHASDASASASRPIDIAERFFTPRHLERALELLLGHYPLLGATLETVEATGTPRVRDLDAGVQFVLAHADGIKLSDLPLSEQSYTSTRALSASLTLHPQVDFTAPLHTHFPFALQLTRFACGSVCVGTNCSHILADGRAFFTLMECLGKLYGAVAAAARTGAKEIVQADVERIVGFPQPPIDRGFLVPPNAAQLLATHTEETHLVPDPWPPAYNYSPPQIPNIFRVLRFKRDELERLKQHTISRWHARQQKEREAGHSADPDAKEEYISTYNALAAHLFRVYALGKRPELADAAVPASDANLLSPSSAATTKAHRSTLLMATEIRRRLAGHPGFEQLTPSYFGNAALYSSVYLDAEVAASESEVGRVAMEVHRAVVRRYRPEAMAGTLAWLNAQPHRNRIQPHCHLGMIGLGPPTSGPRTIDMAITAWNKFPIYTCFESDLKPVRVCFSHIPGADQTCILLPTPNAGEIDVVFGAPEDVMHRIEAMPLFRQFR